MKPGFVAIAVCVFAFSLDASLLAGPRIPGHERVKQDSKNDLVDTGRLLVEELQCAACHTTTQTGNSKQAPILTSVMSRAKADHLRKFILDPHQTKPGTSMPALLTHVDEAESKVDALLHYLGSLSDPFPTQGYANFGGKRRGEALFHSVGCVACHDPANKTLATSVPLGNLPDKYALPSLAQFLLNPLHARPSGRMPSLNLSNREANDIAAYLLPSTPEKAGISYEYYELNDPERLPDFDQLQPKATGTAAEFDLQRHAERRDNFGVRYSGLLQVVEQGEYRFDVASDDGTKLYIDGKVVIDNDGVHGMQRKSATVTLSPGRHAVQLDYFERAGGEELEAQFRPPGGKRGRLDRELVSSAPQESFEDVTFVVDPEKAAQGKTLFATLGCSACHVAQESVPSGLTGPAMAKLDSKQGCLSTAPRKVNFQLDPSQRTAIQGFISSLDESAPAWTDQQRIQHATLQFNCLACHQRGELGGVETERAEYFQTTQMEMGIEGSIPPHLNGVGDKLTLPWLEQILAEGAKDRPYMLTRMPKFGKANVGHLAAMLAQTDQVPAQADIPVDESAKKIGHRLVGVKGFSCIKCHTFGRHRATGVQSIDMTIMTKRLRKDWFRRYVRNPQAYRKGTRMPSAWPLEGKSYLPELLDGDSDQQIAAVWKYLESGTAAITPSGLATGSKELIPIEEAIIYRNFIQGAGPRAIGVGSPEGLHYAFDANELRLAMIWQGAFINAQRHWTGRGQGFEPPAGNAVKALVSGLPIATLASPSASWPAGTASEADHCRFLGYRLTSEQRYPELRYQIGNLRVADFITPRQTPTTTTLVRKLTVTGNAKADTYFRAATGEIVHDEREDGHTFDVGDGLQIRISHDDRFVLRDSQGRDELLLPLTSPEDVYVIELEYIW